MVERAPVAISIAAYTFFPFTKEGISSSQIIIFFLSSTPQKTLFLERKPLYSLCPPCNTARPFPLDFSYVLVPAGAPSFSWLPWACSHAGPAAPGSRAAVLPAASLGDLLLCARSHKAGRWALRWWQGQQSTGCAEEALVESRWEQTVKGRSGSFQSCFEQDRNCSLWRSLRFQSLGSEMDIKLKRFKF